MTHATMLFQASEKVRGFAARIWRSGKAVAGKVGDAVDTVRFYSRNMFGPRTVRALAIAATVAVPTVLFAGGFVQADFLTDMAGTVALLLANILQIITSFVGWLLVTVIGVLIWVSQYNGFITSPAVVNGWALTRDIVNMFFVIFLLMMAFGIMLNLDRYSSVNPGKEIVKLATAAILVNFSRTICGLLIDLSQVVMMTFVYGFKEAAGKNFLDAFQITATLQSLNANPGEAADGGTLAFRVTVSMMLALLMTTIALGVVTVMTIMLAVRIVHLWVLVAISPVAFLPDKMMSKLDGIKSQWWQDFTSALVFGPLMAFFLWLSLVSVAGGQLATAGFQTVDYGAEAGAVANSAASGDIGLTEAFKDSNIQAFVIAIALLTMGTKKAKDMAGAIGKTSEGIYGSMKKSGKGVLKGAVSKDGYGRKALSTAGNYVPGGAVRDQEGKLRLISANSRLDMISAGREKKAQEKVQLADEKTQLAEAKRQRLIGQSGKADEIEKKVLEGGAKSLSARNSPEQLRKLMNDPNASLTTRQQAMKALADKGDESLKGKGAELTNMVSSVGGNDDFEKSIRESLKAKGDNDAMIKKSGDIADSFEQMSAGQVSNQFEKILDGVAIGADGKRKQVHAVDKLLAVDAKKDFGNDKFKAKEKVLKALSVAAQTEKDSALQKKLQDKYDELLEASGFKGNARKMGEIEGDAKKLASEMSSKNLKDDVKRFGEGKGTFAPKDVAAGEILNSGSAGKVTAAQVEALKNLQTRLGRGDVMDGNVVNEIESALTAFRDAGLKDDKERGFVDEAGNSLSNLDLVEQSAMFKNLEGAAKSARFLPPAEMAAMSDKERADYEKKRRDDVVSMLKIATVGVEDADGGDSKRRAAFATVAKNAAGGLKSSVGDIERASGSGVTGDMRTKAVRKAVKSGTAAIDAMVKRGGASPELEKELNELKSDLKALGRASDPNDQATLMADVKDKMDKMQKRLG